MNDVEKKVLSGCYHDGVVYATGYELEDGEIELDRKLFTTFDSGIDGGVMAQINRLDASFNPSNDIRRFAVSLRLEEVMDDEGCYECGTHDIVEGDTLCENCLDDEDNPCDECCEYECVCDEMCDDCHGFDCVCDDDDFCDEEWCSIRMRDELCDECDEYECVCDDVEVGDCLGCGHIVYDNDKYCKHCIDLGKKDETNVSSLNAFHRARYLKSKE